MLKILDFCNWVFFVGLDYDNMENGGVDFIFCYTLNDLEQCWALKNQHK